jgi:hypothetical protein
MAGITLFQFWHAITVVALFAFAITTMILTSHTQQIMSHYSSFTPYFGLTEAPYDGPSDSSDPLDTSSPYTTYFPQHLLTGPNKFILASGCISLVASVFGFWLLWIVKHSRLAALGFLLASTSTGTALGGLIYAMSVYPKFGKTRDDWAVYEENHETWVYTWTVEGWTCTLKDLLIIQGEAKDYGTMCKDSVS